nr:plant ubx domain-containing protein 7 [Quercus suber]
MSNFFFWQVYDDTTEGRKVCTYYKLDSFPVVLVIDPITDETNEEDEEIIHALAASMEGMKDLRGRTAKDKDVTVTEEEKTCTTKKLAYPPLPEEPKGDRNLLCRVRFRLPDGRKVQRNFFRTDSIQLLWSFCNSQLEEAEMRPFQLTHAIPGASRSLDYDNQSTLEESRLANSMISITWD